jgi:hypothetical protein
VGSRAAQPGGEGGQRPEKGQGKEGVLECRRALDVRRRRCPGTSFPQPAGDGYADDLPEASKRGEVPDATPSRSPGAEPRTPLMFGDWNRPAPTP